MPSAVITRSQKKLLLLAKNATPASLQQCLPGKVPPGDMEDNKGHAEEMSSPELAPAVPSVKVVPMPNRRSLKKRNILKLALLVMFFVALAAVSITLPVKSYFLATLLWIEGLGKWGLVAYVGVYTAGAVLFLPQPIIAMCGGFLFDMRVAFVVALLGSTCGACTAFLIGRFFLREFAAHYIERKPRLMAMNRAVCEQGIEFLVMLRLVGPYNFNNFFLSVTTISFRDYCIASVLAALPYVIVYVYIGSAFRSITELFMEGVPKGASHNIFFFVGLAVVVVGAVFFIRRTKNKLLATADVYQ